MQIIGQGLVLMLAGMGIVCVFLLLLILVTKLSCGALAKYDSILPQEPQKKPAAKKPEGAGDADVALAIAVALSR